MRIFFGLALALGLSGVLFLDFVTDTNVASTLTLMAATALGLHEFYRIYENRDFSPARWLGVAAGVLLFAAQWLRCASTKASFLLDHDPVDSVLFAVLLILAVRTLLRHRREKALENLSVTVAGLLYIWFPLAFLFKARNLTGLSTAAGVWAICHLMATAKIGDVGAFFTGKFLGRRKLAPSISPGKTVEGSMGGLAASTLLSVVMCLSVPELRAIYGLLGGIVFGLVVGVLSQAGDLFESHIKRMAGVKNSGDLIPEFGGMLDIVDSLLFSTPVAYFLLVAFH